MNETATATSALIDDLPCCCVHRSATACWAERYDIEIMDVEADGGPCMCHCHDGCDDDEWEDEW